MLGVLKMSISKSKNLSPVRILDAHVPWACLKTDEFVYVPCPLCGSFTYEVKASLVINWAEFFIVQCPDCRITWLNPMPDNTFLFNLYLEDYFDIRKYPIPLIDQVGIADTDETDQRKRRELTQNEVRNWMRKGILPKNRSNTPHKLLEIGGGRGYLQRAAEDEGWVSMGLEISPRRVLRMVGNILKDDGLIIIRVPCINEDEIPKYHLIDHIWHFSENTIEMFLNRENFVVSSKHASGRFPGGDGQVQNMTYFTNKVKIR